MIVRGDFDLKLDKNSDSRRIVCLYIYIYICYEKSLLRYFLLLYEVIKKTFKKTLYSPIFVDNFDSFRSDC